MAKILVAEDEESIRRLVEITLADVGHEVTGAADGREAVDMIIQDPPDMLVLDVMMPALDGWGVLRELRKLGLKQDMRVVMLTAKSSESDFMSGWKLGVDAYVTKPFDPDELAVVVNETLMMSIDQLKEKRAQELEKANLLSRIEAAFGGET